MDEWYNFELYRLSKERNACVGRHDIINVNTFGYFQFDRPCYKFLEQVFEGNQHYPESCVRITSLGNGWLAMAAWKIMSPFIPARTKEKLRAVGTDFMPVLLESMEIDQKSTSHNRIYIRCMILIQIYLLCIDRNQIPISKHSFQVKKNNNLFFF